MGSRWSLTSEWAVALGGIGETSQQGLNAGGRGPTEAGGKFVVRSQKPGAAVVRPEAACRASQINMDGGVPRGLSWMGEAGSQRRPGRGERENFVPASLPPSSIPSLFSCLRKYLVPTFNYFC